MRTKKSLSKTKHRKDSIVDIYHRLVRYPLFTTKKKTLVIQKFEHGQATMQALEPVTVEDEEKLFAVLYLMQQNKTFIKRLKVDDDNEFIYVVCNIKDIAKLVNNNDYSSITNSFRKLAGIVFSFTFTKGSEKIELVTHPVLRFLYNKTTSEIQLLFEKFFVEKFQKKTLQLDLENYLKLRGNAKNLYKFLLANADKKQFLLQTIKERCNIEATLDKHLRQKVKEAMLQIQTQTDLVKSFKIQKDHLFVKFKKQEIPSLCEDENA